MERVSIVVPTFNQAQYLAACLDSLFFQEYPDIELIIVNDGSTDATGEVLDAYFKNADHDLASYACCFDAAQNRIQRRYHKRYEADVAVQLIHNPHNLGLAATLNVGFKAATGVYGAYAPSDNIYYPHMIGELVRALEDAQADFAYADMAVVTDEMRVLRRFSLPDYSFENCFLDWYLCGVAKLYKTELHARCGYYREELLAHDHELFLRFAEAGARFVHVNKMLMAVRDHGAPRRVDIHSPANWSRLLEESKDLVRRARAFHTATQGQG
jgi:glycosyltransferase involved in cell wall biosynthesis